ncbi:cytochrome P450 [Mycena latifolia]|nr:cytochrome P450 [Mycena latifolia]
MSTLPSSFPLSLDTLSTLRPVDLAGLIGYPIIGNLLNWPSDYQAETMQLRHARPAPTDSVRRRLHGPAQVHKGGAGHRCFKHEALLDEEGRRLSEGSLIAACAAHPRFSSSLSLRMVDGFDAREVDDPHVLLAEEMMQLAEFAVIGGWLLPVSCIGGANYFFLKVKHLPRWFPGAGFQKRADYYRAKITEMITKPWEDSEFREKQITGQTNPDSFCAINMHKYNNGASKHTETLITATATAMYGGASDTTASAAWPFMLNSRGRASFSASPPGADASRADMPYLTQIVWEVFRWAPPVPVTLPHRNRVQDEFDGYILPRDTTMVASLYSITHDLEFHADPEAFDPDRYTDGKKRVPYYVFGYGHRRCPGADMAFAQLFHQASWDATRKANHSLTTIPDRGPTGNTGNLTD